MLNKAKLLSRVEIIKQTRTRLKNMQDIKICRNT